MVNTKPNSGSFQKGSVPWNKGKRIKLDLKLIIKEYFKEFKSTEEIGIGMGVSQKTIENRLKENGYKLRKKWNHPERTKQKISKTNKERGIEPKERYNGVRWNKGLSGEEYLKHYPEGRVWNKDKTGLQKSNKKGKTYDELYGKENADKFKKIIKKRRSKQIFPLKDTKIEIRMQELLKELKIKFKSHRYMKEIEHAYQCDIFIKKLNLVIECDGVYWHKYPVGREIDILRTKELLDNGFKVLRFWGSEIKELTKEELKNKINQVTIS